MPEDTTERKERMQSLINHLNQLQELVLIRDEHRTTGDGSHMERLNESIDQLTDKLPPEMKTGWSRWGLAQALTWRSQSVGWRSGEFGSSRGR